MDFSNALKMLELALYYNLGALPQPIETHVFFKEAKMETVCMACYSPAWTRGHFDHLDAAVENYNENYFKPTKKDDR